MSLDKYYKNNQIEIEYSEDIEFTSKYSIQFYFNENKYFFKENDNSTSNIYAELLAGKIGEKLGLNVLKVKPCVFTRDNKRYDGIISENYVDKYDIRIPWKSFRNLYDTPEYFDWYCPIYLSYDCVIDYVEKYIKYIELNQGIKVKLDKNFYQDLRDIIFLDFLLLQNDREFRNIEFILKENKKNNCWDLRVAPIYDNSMIFGFYKKNELKKLKSQMDYKRYIKEISEKMNFKFALVTKSNYKEMANSIKRLAVINSRMQDLVFKAINININECIIEIEKENNITYSPEFKQLAIAGWENTKKTLTNFKLEKWADEKIQRKNKSNNNLLEFI